MTKKKKTQEPTPKFYSIDWPPGPNGGPFKPRLTDPDDPLYIGNKVSAHRSLAGQKGAATRNARKPNNQKEYF